MKRYLTAFILGLLAIPFFALAAPLTIPQGGTGLGQILSGSILIGDSALRIGTSTPSGLITAGTDLSWSGSTLNFDNSTGYITASTTGVTATNFWGKLTGTASTSALTANNLFVTNGTIAGTLGITGSTTLSTLGVAACDVKASTAGSLYCGTDSTGSGSITFGTDNQVPYTNASADDYDYSANFTYNGSLFATPNASTTLLTVGTSLWFGNATGTAVTANNFWGGTFNGTGNFGNASTTNLSISGLSSALLQVNATGAVGEYAGTSCTNQFPRSLSALGIATCATVANTDLENSTVSYGGVQLSLGGSDATPAFDLTDATSLPVATGISGLGSGVATWLATPSSANLASAVTGETGSGALVFGTNPTFGSNITVTGNILASSTAFITAPVSGVVMRLYENTGGEYSQFSINSDGELLIGNDGGGSPNLTIESNGDISVLNSILHLNDGDTYIDFNSDEIVLHVGGINMLTLTESTNDIATALGEWDFGGATSLEVPNGASPTVDATGEMAVDTSSPTGQLQVDMGTSTVAFSADKDRGWSVASTSPDWFGRTLGSGATTTWPVLSNISKPLTVNSLSCKTFGGGTVWAQVSDGTNHSNAAAGSGSPSRVTMTTNNTFVTGEDVWIYIGSAASSPDMVTCTLNISETVR